jgi:nuclear RNA export factor
MPPLHARPEERRVTVVQNMAEDEDLRKNNIQPPGVAPGAVGSRVAAAIFKLAAELQPEVRTLSLANNNIPNGGIVSAIARYLPKLANLSLQGNKLERLRDIDIVTGRKAPSFRLTELKELILAGNPVRENEIQAGKYDEFRQYVSWLHQSFLYSLCLQ